MANEVQLRTDIGTLAPKPNGETRQQFAEELVKRLLVYLPSTNATFNIGGSQPSSDEGPWFKEVTDPKSGDSSYELWVWSSTAATYVPLTLNQTQLRYYVGTAAPSQNTYDVWIKTDSAGAPLGVLTYDTADGAWEPVCYTPAEVDAFFEGEDSGKKQVDWARILNAPASASFVPRAVSGALLVGDAQYDWEQVYHTDIGQMVVYDPVNTIWKTLSGGVGDMKFVQSSILGTTGDFAAGTFGTALGRNPGWTVDSAAAGRHLVAADDTDLWDSTTPLNKDAGSTYGADQFILTDGNIPAGFQVQITTCLDINGGGPVANGFMVGDTCNNRSTQNLNSSAANSDPISKQPESIAYHFIRKIL